MKDFSSADIDAVLRNMDLGWKLREEMEREGARPSFWWRKLHLRQEEGRIFYLSFRFQGGQGELELHKQGNRFVARKFSVRSG